MARHEYKPAAGTTLHTAWADGYMAGVEDGERSAKRGASARGDLNAEDIKKINSSGSALAHTAATAAEQRELDAAFGLLKPSGAVVVNGAIQQFGGLVSSMPGAAGQ